MMLKKYRKNINNPDFIGIFVSNRLIMLYQILSAFPMFACLFWTVQLLSDFRHNDRAKRFLTLFMAVAALLYFCHYVYFNRAYEMLPVTDSIYAFTTLAVYPLYFLYIKLLSESRKLRVRDFYTLIPAVLSCSACAVIYLMMDYGERSAYLQQVIFGHAKAAGISPLAYAQDVRYKLTGIVFAFQIIPILYLGSRKIARYNREINDFYSNTEGKTFSEIRTLLIFFVATSAASFVMNIIGKHHFADSVWMILIPSLLFSTLLYSLGFIGNKHYFTAVDFARDKAGNDSFDTNGKEYPGDLAKTILELIESKELYCQPDIKVSDIAGLLRTNRTYISAAINKELKVSFSALINDYRVERAKKLIVGSISTGKKMTKTEIIEQSGFSNESSFYRAFKIATGTTPQKWLAQQLKD